MADLREKFEAMRREIEELQRRVKSLEAQKKSLIEFAVRDLGDARNFDIQGRTIHPNPTGTQL